MVISLFENQVRQRPDEIALAFEGSYWTYAQLHTASNQLASYLQEKGVEPGAFVGIMMPRSFDFIVGILATMKIGAAYLPLDPEYPRPRLISMLKQAKPTLVLTKEQACSWIECPQLVFDKEQNSIKKKSECNVSFVPHESDPAYLIFTSGSTGEPKGVLMTQRGLSTIVSWHLAHDVSERQRTLSFASFSFDVSTQEVFSTLCSGGILSIASEVVRTNPIALAHLILEEGIERLFMPFTPLQYVIRELNKQKEVTSLRHIITAGEPVKTTKEIIHFFQKNKECVFHNQYGLTEVHTVTDFTLKGEPASWPLQPPVGKSIPGAYLYLLDENFEPVAPGEQGEIFIGGATIAIGYQGREDLTKERFFSDPFSQKQDARMYRTGDLGRLLPEGDLHCEGRKDKQVKIRGHRIEPSEIELCLLQHPFVQEAFLLAHHPDQGERRLVAYLVCDQKRTPSLFDLRSYLEQRLPDYMIPSEVVFLEKMPLSSNGKVDERALPPPEKAKVRGTYQAPQNLCEVQLVKVWEALLEESGIGIHDHFFMLGGHSFSAALLLQQIKENFGVQLTLLDIYDYPTIHALSQHIISLQKQGTCTEQDRLDALIQEIENMSEEEAMEALNQTLESN